MVVHRSKRLATLLPLFALLLSALPMQRAAAATVIATAVGSFQNELGCQPSNLSSDGDWNPPCDLTLMSDPDGDGTYTLTVPAGKLPVGNYEYKVALNRTWDVSYPANNQAFRIAAADNGVTFSYNSATNAVSANVSGTRPPAIDGDIFWDGLGHNSRDPLYRLPGGATTANSKVTLRFRTFSNDATGVQLRTYHTGLGAEKIYDMQRVAIGVPCDDPQLAFRCDFWAATIDVGPIGTLYYRFIVTDGAKTVFYEDDSDVRDGGWGKAYDTSPDFGWALTVYDPNFKLPIQWMKQGIVYQIFPDRFNNGDPRNDPTPVKGNPRLSSDPRYAYPNGEQVTNTQPQYDQIVRMQWGARPEGYCRNYQDISDAECPQRFVQPAASREQPRGRDYYGGDLKGVTAKLDYLKQLGVTIIYFNPIFSAASNHRYDTRDYMIIDRYLGNLGDFKTLDREANARGIRIILDGVFNHMSSDSPIFDRYGNWPDADYNGQKVKGACEDVNSPFRKWFKFRKPNANEPAACAPYTRDGNSYYDSWAGFDSLAQLSEDPEVQAYIQSVGTYWLNQGAEGWRLDVMQDKSIPFWEKWRAQVKAAKPDAVIIGELWKKFDVLPYINGNTADSAMNYRLRDAVIGLLAPGGYDGKGFPSSGQPINPSDFTRRLQSVREDYPDATYYSLMNLLDSHDTERVLWTLTPGKENPAEREQNPANVNEGKQRQRLAALIQFTMPGAPTIYYGDEAGLTGDDDPDDRRTYPWGNIQGDARQPDRGMTLYYAALTQARSRAKALTDGDLRFLLANDADRTVAYGRKLANSAAIVAVNASKTQRTLTIPVADYLPNGTKLIGVAGNNGGQFSVTNGALTINLPALGGALLMTRDADLTPTVAPANLQATADGLSVTLHWNAVSDATGYNVYRSAVAGGGYVKINSSPVSGTSLTDSSPDLRSGQRYFYVVKALDNVGNESAPSNEASAVPSYTIGWANLQWPPTLDYTVSAKNTTDTVYGQVWIDGVTNQPGATPGLIAQLGYGAPGSDPRTWNTWVNMAFNVDAGNNDEYKGALQPTTPGTYSYFTRYSTSAGESWTYGDLDGIGDGSFAQQTNQPGTLTVRANADQTPPDAPTGLQATNGGANAIMLQWTKSAASDVFRYDLLRSTTAGSGYAKIADVDASTTQYTDTTVQTGTAYFYVVRAVDEAANVSGNSNEASATPSARKIQVTFEVTPPTSTPGDATVYIVGNQSQICNWCNPHTVALTKGGDGKWRVTLTFLEGKLVEYKYTLGSWDVVEKDSSCGEIGNRQARVASASGTQLVQDTVANWRNVPPCGS